jgi:hypothetical protein
MGNDLMSSSLVYRWPVLGLLFRNVGPETKALGFSNAINFPALWTCGQDDDLVIDNQGFWFRRCCEELPEYRAIELFPSDERLRRRAMHG